MRPATWRDAAFLSSRCRVTKFVPVGHHPNTESAQFPDTTRSISLVGFTQLLQSTAGEGLRPQCQAAAVLVGDSQTLAAKHLAGSVKWPSRRSPTTTAGQPRIRTAREPSHPIRVNIRRRGQTHGRQSLETVRLKSSTDDGR